MGSSTPVTLIPGNGCELQPKLHPDYQLRRLWCCRVLGQQSSASWVPLGLPPRSGQLKLPQQLIDIGTVLNRPPEKPRVLLQTAIAGFHDHAGYVLAGVDLLALLRLTAACEGSTALSAWE